MFRLSELEEFRGPEDHSFFINKESPKPREVSCLRLRVS